MGSLGKTRRGVDATIRSVVNKHGHEEMCRLFQKHFPALFGRDETLRDFLAGSPRLSASEAERYEGLITAAEVK